MPKKRKVIDLNEFQKVNNEDDLEGYQHVIIRPIRLADGTQLPDLFFRKGEPKHREIDDTSDVTWNKDIRISIEGDEVDYAKRVDWWANSAVEDDEYRNIINDTFNKNDFNVKISWDKAISYLKDRVPSQRKSYIHKFIWNWLSKGYRWQLERLEKGGRK